MEDETRIEEWLNAVQEIHARVPGKPGCEPVCICCDQPWPCDTTRLVRMVKEGVRIARIHNTFAGACVEEIDTEGR